MATENARAHHGNRHGRSEEGRQAILQAADDLLVDKGFDGVTMEGIAKRAGVAKQTIYRWWRSKTDVLLEAFLQDAAEDLAAPDTGDVATDLVGYLERLAWFLGESESGMVFRALIARAQLDAEFAREFRAACLVPQRHRGRLPLERAIERGQLPAGLDVDAEIDQLVAPLFYHVLVTGTPVAAEEVGPLVTAFLARHDAASASAPVSGRGRR